MKNPAAEKLKDNHVVGFHPLGSAQNILKLWRRFFRPLAKASPLLLGSVANVGRIGMR